MEVGKEVWGCEAESLLILVSKLLYETFWIHLSFESFNVFAVVIDHVVVSNPLQLAHLTTAQLAVCRKVHQLPGELAAHLVMLMFHPTCKPLLWICDI